MSIKSDEIMQKKIIDFTASTQNATMGKNKKTRWIAFGFLLLLFSIFGAGYIFADVMVEFDKDNYTVMEGTSIRVGFTVFNDSNNTVNLWFWSECDEDEDEISCSYSQRLTMPANSSQSSSFYVNGVEDSSASLTLYVNNLNTGIRRAFSTNIDVTDDEEDGEFEIDVYNTSLCIGKTNTLTLELNNNTSNGLYNLSLVSNILQINQAISNPVYLGDEKEIDYYVFVPETVQDGQRFNLVYTIENEHIKEKKAFDVFARECPDTYIDFSVTGPTIVSYYINKSEEKSVTYTIKNNSRNYKTIYISEEGPQGIDISIDKRQVTVSPNNSQQIEVRFSVTEEIASGNYDINLSFFDGINSVSKKIRLMVNPEHEIVVESINGLSQTLYIGENLELLLLIKNTGDIRDEFTIATTADNDLQVRTTENSFSVYPYMDTAFSIFLSAGNNTVPGYAYLTVKIRGSYSDFYKEYLYIIDVRNKAQTTTLDFLAYPKAIDITPNSTQTIDFVLKNTGNSKVVIESVELTNVSQEITMATQHSIEINAGKTKTISITLNIGDVQESQKAKIRFVTDNGVVLEKAIDLRLTLANASGIEKSGVTGFLTIRNSILTGVIVACLVVILLFVCGIFKAKKV